MAKATITYPKTLRTAYRSSPRPWALFSLEGILAVDFRDDAGMQRWLKAHGYRYLRTETVRLDGLAQPAAVYEASHA